MDKTKATACGSQGLGWSPRPCVGCHSSSLFRTHACRWKGSWEWANSTPGLSGPRAPPGTEPQPSEQPQAWYLEKRDWSFPSSASPVQYRFPNGFQTQIPSNPDPLTHLFSDLSFMKSFQFFLLNQLFCCFFQLPPSSKCLPLLQKTKRKLYLRKMELKLTKYCHSLSPLQPNHCLTSRTMMSNRAFCNDRNVLYQGRRLLSFPTSLCTNKSLIPLGSLCAWAGRIQNTQNWGIYKTWSRSSWQV